MFEKVIERYNVEYVRIPVGCKIYNSDVERFYGIIENEFYDYVKFKDKKELLDKISYYQYNFNPNRANSYKGYRSPKMIIKDRG